MAFTSFSFIAFVIAVVLLTALLPSPTGRGIVLIGANAVFIASYVGHFMQVVPLAAFLVSSYLAIEVVRRHRSGWILGMGVVLVIAMFMVLKKFSFLSNAVLLPFPYLVIGLSYVLFRVLHLMVDLKQGELSRAVSPMHFFNYTCNFLTFVAGPIQRYQDYLHDQGRALALSEKSVYEGVARTIKGFVKVGVASAIFKYLFDNVSGRVLDTSPESMLLFHALFVASALCFTVYLYANFAGYMDIVIGVGSLIGQRLPENFNSPFLARNFLDFWSRWHMTLSDWFKTYLFNPLLMWMAMRVTAPKAGPYLGVVAFFVTFLVMGVWHGTTSVFVIYGLLMGAGASFNKLWQMMAVKRLGKKQYKALAERPVAIYLSRGLTMAYFGMALTCLWVDLPQLATLTSRLGMAGLLGCYLALAVCGACAFWVWDRTTAFAAPMLDRLHAASRGVVARNLALALQIMLIATVTSFFHKAPEFVYRAF